MTKKSSQIKYIFFLVEKLYFYIIYIKKKHHPYPFRCQIKKNLQVCHGVGMDLFVFYFIFFLLISFCLKIAFIYLLIYLYLARPNPPSCSA